MAKHLAILNKQAIDDIFSGKKKVEGRFSKIKIAPFGRVFSNDVVLVKLPGDDIVGQIIVDRVFSYDHPTLDEVEVIKNRYKSELSVDASFWKDRDKINYITLMFIRSATKFIVPPKIKKSDLRPWVVLEEV